MWLLVGGDLEIGAATRRHLLAHGAAVVATTRRSDRASRERPLLDLSHPLDTWEAPAGTNAACIFAAVARLADCASDPAGSAYVNVTQTVALVEKLLAHDIYTLFLSSDKVFDGSLPCVPGDAPTSPNSEYGRQKARAESILRRHMDAGAPVGILRLAKVVSPDTALLHRWIGTLAQNQPIRVFHDMGMAPIPVDLVAAAVMSLLRDRARGVFQLSGPRDVTYAEIGRHLAERIGADPVLVEAVSAVSEGLPKGAAPPHTTLDSSLIQRRYGIVVPDVWAVISACLTRQRGGLEVARQSSDDRNQ